MTAAESIDLFQISTLVGGGLPVIASVLKQDRLGSRANTVIAVAVAITAAVVVTAVRHELTPQNLAISFAAMYTTAVAFHLGLWKPTGIAPGVQTRTSAKRNTPPATLDPAPTTPRATTSDLARC